MGLKDELWEEISNTLASRWTEREGRVVPEAEDVALGNEAVKLDEAVVLYADMSGSTKLVDIEAWYFAAEIYKSFLYAAAKIIRSEGGVITAYDGDRVMAVYLGDSKNTSAARTALKINYCRLYFINPLIEKHYPSTNFRLQNVVGIDTSTLHVARTGVRGANDLVWVGRAANYAAKLTDLSADFPSRITGDVYDLLNNSVKFSDGKAIWEQAIWKTMDDKRIYRSKWTWRID
jgi:class 3 adenylate cyclase